MGRRPHASYVTFPEWPAGAPAPPGDDVYPAATVPTGLRIAKAERATLSETVVILVFKTGFLSQRKYFELLNYWILKFIPTD